jgi:hypothetical protein
MTCKPRRPSTRLRPLAAALWVAAAATVAGCGGDDADPDEPGRQVESRAGEGREETRGIRNAENIGYSGNAIGAKLDQALDTQDNRPADLERQIDQQTE